VNNLLVAWIFLAALIYFLSRGKDVEDAWPLVVAKWRETTRQWRQFWGEKSSAPEAEDNDLAIVTRVCKVPAYTVQVAASHFVLCWGLYRVFGLSGYIGRCLLAIIAAFLSVINLFPGWVFSLPGLLELWLPCKQGDGAVEVMIVFLFLYFHLVDTVDTALYNHVFGTEEILNRNLVSICVFGGWYLFPGFSGVVLGPLALLVAVSFARNVGNRVKNLFVPPGPTATEGAGGAGAGPGATKATRATRAIRGRRGRPRSRSTGDVQRDGAL